MAIKMNDKVINPYKVKDRVDDLIDTINNSKVKFDFPLSDDSNHNKYLIKNRQVLVFDEENKVITIKNRHPFIPEKGITLYSSTLSYDVVRKDYLQDGKINLNMRFSNEYGLVFKTTRLPEGFNPDDLSPSEFESLSSSTKLTFEKYLVEIKDNYYNYLSNDYLDSHVFNRMKKEQVAFHHGVLDSEDMFYTSEFLMNSKRDIELGVVFKDVAEYLSSKSARLNNDDDKNYLCYYIDDKGDSDLYDRAELVYFNHSWINQEPILILKNNELSDNEDEMLEILKSKLKTQLLDLVEGKMKSYL